MGADGVVIEDWCAMILEPQGELKYCGAPSNMNHPSIFFTGAHAEKAMGINFFNVMCGYWVQVY